MLKQTIFRITIIAVLILTVGCSLFEKNKNPKIGISFAIGPAVRWQQEQVFMEKRAQELGLSTIARSNTLQSTQSQQQDCIELIDSGIELLIIMPRNSDDFVDVLQHAKAKKVKVIAYARPFTNQGCDLFVGYDTRRIGQNTSLYVTETATNGNFIVLRGDKHDYNSSSLYEGLLSNLAPAINDGAKVILNDLVPSWSPEAAKNMVRESLQKNNQQISAILAPNDQIAQACVEVLKEFNISKEQVVVTGMDAELSALQRIANGEQDLTVYMSLQELSTTAIDQANNLINGKKPLTNSEFVDQHGNQTPAYLISGKPITKENLDRTLIQTGIFTKEQIYLQ